MSKLQWDKDNERKFENGVRNGVLYTNHDPFDWDPMVVTDPFTSASGPYAVVTKAYQGQSSAGYPRITRESGIVRVSVTFSFAANSLFPEIYLGSEANGWKHWNIDDIQSDEDLLEILQISPDAEVTQSLYGLMGSTTYMIEVTLPSGTDIPDYSQIGSMYYLRSYPSTLTSNVLYGPTYYKNWRRIMKGAYIGYPWNGLTAISESPEGGEPNDQYADDMKYSTLFSKEIFKGTIEAYTYPDAYEYCDGSYQVANGVSLHQQPREPFCLSYKTRLNSSADPDGDGYLLHLVYGCMASPSERTYETINDSPDAMTFSWEFDTTPTDIVKYIRPASLITIDSTKVDPERLASLENILYGSDAPYPQCAIMPTPHYVCSLLGYADGNQAKTNTVKLSGLRDSKNIILYEPLTPGEYDLHAEYNGTYNTSKPYIVFAYSDGNILDGGMFRQYNMTVSTPSKDHVMFNGVITVSKYVKVDEFAALSAGANQPEDATGVLSYISITPHESEEEQPIGEPIEVDIPDDP